MAESEPAHVNIDENSSAEPDVVAKTEENAPEVVVQDEAGAAGTTTPATKEEEGAAAEDNSKTQAKDAKESRQNMQAEARRKAQEVGLRTNENTSKSYSGHCMLSCLVHESIDACSLVYPSRL